MAKRVFLDTNIIIDLLDRDRPHHADSSALLRTIQEGGLHALVSSISIVNTTYVLRRVLPPDIIARYLLSMLEVMELSRLGDMEMKMGLTSGWQDLEDAVQFASAMASGPVDAIISHDADMKQQTLIPVWSSKECIERLDR